MSSLLPLRKATEAKELFATHQQLRNFESPSVDNKLPDVAIMKNFYQN
jgi:hypothetical protein